MAEASMEARDGDAASRDTLRRDWHEFKGKRLDERVAEEWRLFLDWKRSDPVDTLALERYTNLLRDGGGIYFTNLIERRTTRCGRFRPASSAGYGIYRIKPENGQPNEALRFSIPGPNNGRAARAEVGLPTANDFFEKNVRPVLVALANYDSRPDLRPLETNFARKVAYMYNPGQLLALYKNEVIARIGTFLGIRDKLKGYRATQAIKEQLTAEWSVSIEDACSWSIDELREWTLADGRKLDDDEIRLTREFEVSQKMTGFLYQRFGLSLDFEQKNVVYYGPPGTGKTHRVNEAIEQRILADGHKFDDMCEIVQFHPSYSYEDFIEGLKPVNVAGGGIALVVMPGVFRRFCKRATDALREDRMRGEKEPRTYYFVADEINRAELSRVLGEVLVCLEESKRIDFDLEGNETGLRVTTQYGYMAGEGEGRFGVPANLYFIGTMNDIDRSVDSFDMALRRRFAWVRTGCDYEVIREAVAGDKHASAYVAICEQLNKFIRFTLKLGQDYEIGHAYFMTIAGRGVSDTSMRQLFDTRIEPLLSEYLRAEYSPEQIAARVKEARKIFSLSSAAKKDEPVADE
ncbi:AAA family ATPase [Massilia sp. YIM B02763]|uniref:McrB family protein n=1 Tax=Massilia sp. YIM B02763 TaxID=3050130 RepID=UPI0025B6BCEF|nr:AAA family ATPase [Massilia sp. YIM B02763]MDN4051760.1 AAA family ATPase [Massilia sp. YIM B02763]